MRLAERVALIEHDAVVGGTVKALQVQAVRQHPPAFFQKRFVRMCIQGGGVAPHHKNTPVQTHPPLVAPISTFSRTRGAPSNTTGQNLF